jgi:hypothetical protein
LKTWHCAGFAAENAAQTRTFFFGVRRMTTGAPLCEHVFTRARVLTGGMGGQAENYEQEQERDARNPSVDSADYHARTK